MAEIAHDFVLTRASASQFPPLIRSPFAAPPAVLAEGRVTVLAEVTGSEGNAVALVAPDDRRLTTGISPPRQQRPLSLFLRQAVDSCIARKVEN